MSATNHTTNYNLPQFIGTDKPTWLTDVNGALSAIDAQMKLNADSASGASSTATTTATALGTITNLNTTDKTSAVNAINEVNTNLGTVSGVASSASGNATNALTKITALESALNFTQFKTYISSDITLQNMTWVGNPELYCASNADGSVVKIYGRINVKGSNTGTMKVTFPSFARPESAINIDGVCLVNRWNGSTIEDISVNKTFAVATDGTITCNFSSTYYNKNVNMMFVACVLFMKDFGDQEN